MIIIASSNDGLRLIPFPNNYTTIPTNRTYRLLLKQTKLKSSHKLTMLCSLYLQWLNCIPKIIKVHIHIVGSRTHQPGSMRGEADFLGRVSVILEDVDRKGQVPEIPNSNALVDGCSYNLLLVFVEVNREDFCVMCPMARDVGFGESMVPHFE